MPWVFCMPEEQIFNCWSTDALETESFPLTIAFRRFNISLKFVRFHDYSITQESEDKLTAIPEKRDSITKS